METEKKLWFIRKPYGWGWTPVTWQGRIVLLIQLVIILFSIWMYDRSSHSYMDGIIAVIIPVLATIGVIILCYKKGEPPRWQRGKK